MSNYFEDIKIKRNTWDEKLDLKSLKESGILAEEQGQKRAQTKETLGIHNEENNN